MSDEILVTKTESVADIVNCLHCNGLDLWHEMAGEGEKVRFFEVNGIELADIPGDHYPDCRRARLTLMRGPEVFYILLVRRTHEQGEKGYREVRHSIGFPPCYPLNGASEEIYRSTDVCKLGGFDVEQVKGYPVADETLLLLDAVNGCLERVSGERAAYEKWCRMTKNLAV